MTTILLVIVALAGAPEESADWALANTLLAEHEHNAALAADCVFTYEEFRRHGFFKRGVKTDAEVKAVVEVARHGDNLLVKRNEATNVRREDGSLYTLKLELVRNGEYLSYFTYPETQLELFYHDRPGPSFDPDRGTKVIPGALGVGPRKCGFGDGTSPLSGVLWAAHENASTLSCNPVREGEPFYAIEITGETGEFTRLVLDLSKGALIVSAIKTSNGQMRSEMEVAPARFGDCWFPKTWKRTTYDENGVKIAASSSGLTSFSKDISNIQFTYESILPSENLPVVTYDEFGEIVEMYSVDGVLVTPELAETMRLDKSKALQPGG